MGIFSFAIENNNEDIIKEDVAKDNIFSYIFELYDIIRGRPDNYTEGVDAILRRLSDSQKGFIIYALNHYLVYNTFTRNVIEMFTMLSNTFLTPEEYIHFYVRYMIENQISFPKYMSWYKLNLYNNNKIYSELIKDKYKLSDEDLIEVLSYFNNKNISIRDIALTIL